MGCSWGRGLVAGKSVGVYGCRGRARGSQRHPSFWSPLPLSSKMCPLVIDWRGMVRDFSCPVLQKELASLSLKRSLASSKGKQARASPAPELNYVLVPEHWGSQRLNKRVSSGWWVPGGQLLLHPRRWPFPNPPRHVSKQKGSLQPLGLISTQPFWTKLCR